MFLSPEDQLSHRSNTRPAMTLQQSTEPDPDNTDGGSGFGYSQKFFHISDGNLYSVFSPLQGRCYGVRPAFLRQHHSGRSHHHRQKSPDHEAKQQTFPMENTTSNRDSEASHTRGRGRGHRRGGSSSSRGRRNRGLKFHNFVPAEKTGPVVASGGQDPGLLWSSSEWRLREEHGTKQITVSNNHWVSEGTNSCHSMAEEEHQKAAPQAQAQSSPDMMTPQGEHVTAPFMLVNTAIKEENCHTMVSSASEMSSNSTISENEQILAQIGRTHHRRKALRTRQVIPYPTYLSMLNDESPLDLSKSPRKGSTSTLEALLLSESTTPRDLPSQSRPDTSLPSTSGSGQQQPTGNISRRPSQRTLIRQKLEDTFKQNGFLVKTKQVSDGDATFCKFKQLRKYTRYYLKSWHQHLPEEVHKLWKGFLPPSVSPPGAPTVEPLVRTSPKWMEPPS